MLKLKRVFEAVSDSSHTSIMYNMADNLKKKGWDVSYNDRLGMTVNFDLTDFDPSNTVEGKKWLRNNPGKTFVFKGDGKKGFFQWNVEKGEDGKRYLTTKNVTVGRDKNITSLQKKLSAPKVDGKLTGKSPKVFVLPDDIPVTNMMSPTFQSFLKKYRDKIISDIALALCEVVDERSKKESYSSDKYFIEYDSDGNRVDEGYVVEDTNEEVVEEKKEEVVEEDKKEEEVKEEDKKDPVDWNSKEVQDEVVKAIKGIEIDKGKTSKDKLVFKYNDKNGSLHLQGYMLVLDMDTDDDVPPTNYPVKDKNNLSVKSLLDTVKVVFSRRESLSKVTENYSFSEDDNSEKESHYYILSSADKSQWNEIVGDSKGYDSKIEAKNVAIKMAKDTPNMSFGVTFNPVDFSHFAYETFWGSVDDERIKIESIDPNDTVEEENNSGKSTNESLEDHTQFHDSPVFLDVAQERFLDSLERSLLLSSECKNEGVIPCDDPNAKVLWVYLSPSYAINQLSDIVVPVCIKDKTLSMPMADMPNPESVFNGEYTSNSIQDYNDAVQNFILHDAPLSDLMELNLDNADDAKARVVDVINSMSEDYQNKKDQLEVALDLTGESLLRESRYYIVPSDSELKTMEEIKKITPMGFTDLEIARESMKEVADSGKYDCNLSIVDTHFSNNNEKWEIL